MLSKVSTYGEFEQRIKKYYLQTRLESEKEIAHKECDIVSVNIAKYLENERFSFRQIALKSVHKNYFSMNQNEQVLSIAQFISNIWQIYPFREGNTRVIACFMLKYLGSLGFDTKNEIFKENSKYFRDALVLANYSNIKGGIKSDFSYLESFFHKLMLDKDTK